VIGQTRNSQHHMTLVFFHEMLSLLLPVTSTVYGKIPATLSATNNTRHPSGG